MDRCLDEGFEVLRVGEGGACHHVDELLSHAVPWLPAVDTRRMDYGGPHGADRPRE